MKNARIRASAKVLANVQHQDRQRDAGIRVAPTPANSPPREALRRAPAKLPRAEPAMQTG